MSIHDGHRQRLKERFCKEGLANFDELHVLELMLFYCVSRRDTNPLAHRLLERFKSLPSVLDANREELMQVEGIGEHTAIFLTMIKEVQRYYEDAQSKNLEKARTISECAVRLAPHLKDRRNERVYMLCLDAKCKVLGCELVGEGSVNSANISIRKIVEIAFRTNASSVVLAHNHPAGVAVPSPEDIQTTRKLGKSLYDMDIVLSDHLIFADDEWISLVQSGQYSPYEDRIDEE